MTNTNLNSYVEYLNREKDSLYIRMRECNLLTEQGVRDWNEFRETIDMIDEELAKVTEKGYIRKLKALKLDKLPIEGNLKTIIQAGTALVSIAMILRYEEENVITSKAFSIASKLVGK